MNLIKSQVTFSDALSIAKNIADACFIQNEDENDTDYSPTCKQASIQVAFVENYTDFIFEVPENEDDKEEAAKIFDENYAKYMAVNIDNITLSEGGEMFNRVQWDSILQSAEELIDFRKQKLIHNKKSSIEEAFESLNIVLSTLNDKAKDIDIKKIEKIINKLSPLTLSKANKKSGMGQNLTKENKNLE